MKRKQPLVIDQTFPNIEKAMVAEFGLAPGVTLGQKCK